MASLRDRYFELLIAGRLLRSRRSVHLSLVTSMSVAGIALGVGALIVVLAVNTGFQAAFQDRILATYPHLVIMRRGVDLHDHEAVAEKLLRVSGVRSVAPATYDDMMLSAAIGRAGAVVRGVPPETLDGLPEGALLAGKIDQRGELPLVSVAMTPTGPVADIRSGIAAARHVLVAGTGASAAKAAPWLRIVSVLPLPTGLAGLVVVDVSACPAGVAALAPPGAVQGDTPIALAHADAPEPLRQVGRAGCARLANWEIAPGSYQLRWRDGPAQLRREVYLADGLASVAVFDGASLHVSAPAPPELGAAVAAVAMVPTGPTAWTLRLPDGTVHAVAAPGASVNTNDSEDKGSVDMWHAFAAELPAIALGEGLARRLQVKIGDEVRAVSPLRGLDRGSDASSSSASGRFRVATLLRTGFYDHDQRLALVDFRAAQRFLGRGDIARWVEIRVDDPILAASRVDVFKAALEPTHLSEVLSGALQLRDRLRDLQTRPTQGMELRAPDDAVAMVDNWVSGTRAARSTRSRALGAYRVVDWEEMNRNIFDAARMQKIAMSLFPFIIVLVAALNVVGTQAVVVHERARDIAILRAMGARRRSVAFIFLTQGLVVGVAGTVIGLATGGLCCLLLDAVGYPLDPQVYLISRLPVLVEGASFALAGGSAILLAFLAAWYAAHRAATRPPVDALRRLD